MTEDTQDKKAAKRQAQRNESKHALFGAAVGALSAGGAVGLMPKGLAQRANIAATEGITGAIDVAFGDSGKSFDELIADRKHTEKFFDNRTNQVLFAASVGAIVGLVSGAAYGKRQNKAAENEKAWQNRLEAEHKASQNEEAPSISR